MPPETWLISEERWSLPVTVMGIEGQVLGLAPCNIPMLRRQSEFLKQKLSSVGNYVNGLWWVPDSVLRTIGKPILGDPEDFVVWDPPVVACATNVSADPERWEFFAEYSRNGVISDPVQAEVVFVSFCKFMLHWMLNRQKSVDLGFCELAPMPYRPNWYQVLLQKDLEREDKIKMEGKYPRLNSNVKSLVGRGVPDDMMDPKLTFWCKEDEHIYWSIGARPKAMWWKMVKAVEQAKQSRGKYITTIRETMKRTLPKALKFYASFLQQARLPYVRMAVREPGVRGIGRREESKSGASCKPFISPRDLPVSISTATEQEPHAVLDHVPEVEGVSEVSGVQSFEVAVRDSGRELVGVADGNAGHPGV